MPYDLATAKRFVGQNKLRELLQIPIGIKGVELEKACRRARVLYHPDRGGDPELASLIGGAVDALLQEEHQKPIFCSRSSPDYTQFLNVIRDCVAKTIAQADDCLSEVGQPDRKVVCTSKRLCKCSVHCIERLKLELRSVRHVIKKGLDVIGDACKYSSRSEHESCSELQHLVSEARQVEGRCNSRMHRFEQTLATNRRDKLKNEPVSLHLNKSDRHQEQHDHIDAMKENGHVQQKSEETENEPQTTNDSREDAPCKFPKTPVWPKAHKSDKGKKLEGLYIAYYKARNKRRMRIQRGQDPKDVDGEMADLLHQAWQVTTTLNFEDCPSNFPPACLWQRQGLEAESEIKRLWKSYRKVGNNRSLRIVRGQTADDLDKQIKLIRQSAWQLVQPKPGP
jgi:hypothetical protein